MINPIEGKDRNKKGFPEELFAIVKGPPAIRINPGRKEKGVG